MGGNKYIVPISIVIAGIIIAGAVFYNNRTSGPATSTNGNGEAQQNEIVMRSVSGSEHILGNPNADVVIVEYSDIDCPFCSAFHITMKRVMDEYGKEGSVAWVYRHFPLTQLHPNAGIKAQASECVAELTGNEAFWAFIDILFEREDESLSDLGSIAAAAGANEDDFESCLDSNEHRKTVEADFEDARGAGGTGTPYNVFVLKDKLDPGAQDAISTIAAQFRPGTIVLGADSKTIGISGAHSFDTVIKPIIDIILF